MAIITQSPAGQPSVSLSGIAFIVETSATPTRRGRKVVSGGTIAASLGTTTSTGPVIPTTGQIWPLGLAQL